MDDDVDIEARGEIVGKIDADVNEDADEDAETIALFDSFDGASVK